MAQVHLTEAEVSRDFTAVLRKVGRGEEIIMGRSGHIVAVIRQADDKPTTLSGLIARAEEREVARGYAVTLDEDFAADVEQIVREREPWTPRSVE
jgi:hypothetical protein